MLLTAELERWQTESDLVFPTLVPWNLSLGLLILVPWMKPWAGCIISPVTLVTRRISKILEGHCCQIEQGFPKGQKSHRATLTLLRGKGERRWEELRRKCKGRLARSWARTVAFISQRDQQQRKVFSKRVRSSDVSSKVTPTCLGEGTAGSKRGESHRCGRLLPWSRERCRDVEEGGDGWITGLSGGPFSVTAAKPTAVAAACWY